MPRPAKTPQPVRKSSNKLGWILIIFGILCILGAISKLMYGFPRQPAGLWTWVYQGQIAKVSSLAKRLGMIEALSNEPFMCHERGCDTYLTYYTHDTYDEFRAKVNATGYTERYSNPLDENWFFDMVTRGTAHTISMDGKPVEFDTRMPLGYTSAYIWSLEDGNDKYLVHYFQIKARDKFMVDGKPLKYNVVSIRLPITSLAN